MKSNWGRLFASGLFAAACALAGFAMQGALAQVKSPDIPEQRGNSAPQKAPSPSAQQKPAPAAKPAPPPVPATNLTLTATLTPGGLRITTGLSWRIYAVKSQASSGAAATAQSPGEPVWSGGGAEAQARLRNGDYIAEVQHGLTRAQKRITIAGGEALTEVISLDGGLLAARALAVPGGLPVSPVFFQVFTEANGQREETGRSSAEPATFNLSAGRYILRANAGLASLETPITVEAGKVTSVDMALNIGTLELKTFAAAGVPKLLPSVHNIYPAQSPAQDRGKPLLRIAGATHRVDLPAGSYRVESIAGLARQEMTVTVNAGQSTSQTVVLNAGEIKVTTPIMGGPEACTISPARMLGLVSSEPLGRVSGPNASFMVPAGRYTVQCHPAGQPAAIRKWAGEIKAGEIVEITPQA